MPLAVYVLGLGIFTVVTSELQVAGMMPLMADDLGVSIPQIGYLIALYALAMAIGGPLLSMMLLRLPQKTALMFLLGIFLVGETLAAVSTNYSLMVVARLVTGAVSGACFGISLAICVDLVEERSRGRATSIVLGGLMVGTVLGLPVASLIGDRFGWRASFWTVVVLTAAAAVVTYAMVPQLPKQQAMSLRGELEPLKSPRLWAVFSTSTLIIGATYAAFSYFSPILTELTGFSSGTVPLLLVVYGIATVVGNNIVGRLADRYTLPVLAYGLACLIVFLILFGAFAEYRVPAVLAMIGVGLVGVTMNPAMVTRVMRTANGRPLVNTVHTSVITLGVVLGSWAGGLGISSGYGLRAPLWVGAAMAVAGLATLVPDLLRRSPADGAAPAQKASGAAPSETLPTAVGDGHAMKEN